MQKRKFFEINEALKQYCEQNSKVSLLSRYNINENALNGSKLHLNEAGAKVFSKNINNCINRFFCNEQIVFDSSQAIGKSLIINLSPEVLKRLDIV